MVTGIFAGVTWALETVIISIALSMTPFQGGRGVFLAPFVSTFLHDAFSALCLWILSAFRGSLREVLSVFKSKDCKWLIIASAIGGPVGMTGYVLAVNCLGASVGAIASAVYPAIGTALAYIFLKEKVCAKQWVFLILTLCGVFGISYSPGLEVNNFALGILGAFMCAFGWGAEGVVLSKCFSSAGVKSEHALQIRQTTSAVIYGAVILPILGGLNFAGEMFLPVNRSALLTIFAAAAFATVSYLLYYKTIAKLGAAKAMSLNITYTAWAMVFSVILFGNYEVLNPVTVICGAAVVVCGILSASAKKQM